MTTAFVLSGGGNLGAMQAGSIAALVEGGVEPDVVVGTSVGALNAAFVATRPGVHGAHALVAAWRSLRRHEAVSLNPYRALLGLSGVRDHLISPRPLRRLIETWIPVERLEQARVPLAAVATDALSGEAVVLTSGPVVDALAASAAIPGLFPPVSVDGRWLIDGSLSANHAVLQAQDLGADEIYLITTVTAARAAPPRGAVAVAMNAVSLVTARNTREQLATAQRRAESHDGRIHLVPSSLPAAPNPFDYRMSAALSDAAYQRTRAWLVDERAGGASPEGGRPAGRHASGADRAPTTPDLASP